MEKIKIIFDGEEQDGHHRIICKSRKLRKQREFLCLIALIKFVRATDDIA